MQAALLFALPGVASGCGGSTSLVSQKANIVVFGDSLTCGGSGNAYGQSPVGSVPTSLQSILNASVLNQGVGGNTSSQIAVRYNAGGTNQVVTLAGNQIPTTGSVQATFPSGWEPVTSNGGNNGAGCYQSLKGSGTNATINGVSGTFTYANGGYLFTPATYPSSAVATSANNAYTVTTPSAGTFLVVSSGTNDFQNGFPPTATLIANDVAMTSLAAQHYLVTSAMPFESSDYWPGSAKATALANLNAAKASTFGSHYVDTLTPLLGGCQPVAGSTLVATDAIDIAHGIVPTSCRSYDAGPLTQNITATQTSFCMEDSYLAVQMIGYLSHTAAPIGKVEAIQITALSTPGGCASGSLVTVTRGYAGTTPGTYTASVDSWGVWSDVHLSGGAANPQLAAKTGYTVQAEVIAAAYTKLSSASAGN